MGIRAFFIVLVFGMFVFGLFSAFVAECITDWWENRKATKRLVKHYTKKERYKLYERRMNK